MAENKVRELNTKAEYDEVLKGEKLVVVDFTAAWCPPCQMIAPKFLELAEQCEEFATLVKVDVDKNKETAEACNIQAMPTFKFYKDQVEIDEVKGANKALLEEKIMQYK